MSLYLYQAISLDEGNVYRIRFDYSSDLNVGPDAVIHAGFAQASELVTQTDFASLTEAVSQSINAPAFSSGTAFFELTAPANADALFFTITDQALGILTIDNVSVSKNVSAGLVKGIHVAYKADGTQILFRKRGTRLEYFDTSDQDWFETGDNIFSDEDEEASFTNYASLAGNQLFVCTTSSGPFKIMTANPDDYSDQYDEDKNFQGHIKIKQNRCVLWGRTKDKTGIYGSYIDNAQYTTVANEVLASGDGSTISFSGTLAFKAGGSKRTCFAVTIACVGGETFTDDYNGRLTGDSGGTGLINYMTGDWEVTFDGTAIPPAASDNIVASYQWENSTNQGLMDFTKSTPRTAGQGFVFRQDDGGGDTHSVESYGDTEYCLHRLKTWALTLTSTDTSATNLIYRDNVGIPNLRAAIATGDGIYYVDDSNEANPKFRLLTLNNISTQVIPLPVSDRLNLQDYRFDKAATWEWGDLILWSCRHEDSELNNRVFVYNKPLKTFDLFDWYVSSFATYNGALVAGDSLSGAVYELFSGFDDNEAAIGNGWEGNLTDFEIKLLKRLKRLWFQGEISRDQTLDFYASIDREPYVLIGTQNGTDSNVDTLPRSLLGTELIGRNPIGGQPSINVYNYVKDIPFRLGKFNHIKLKIIATGIGYTSVSTITFVDLIENYHKLASKYRASTN